MAVEIGDLQGTISLEDEFSSAFDKLTNSVTNSLDSMFGKFNPIVIGATAAAAAIAGMAGAIVALGSHGADINDVAGTLDHFAGSSENAAKILENLRQGTKNTVDDFTLMKESSRLLSAGVNLTADEFKTFGEAAFVLQNRGLGGTKEMMDLVSDAMVTGKTRALAMKLGVVEVSDSQEKLAKSLGVTVEQLSASGKAEANRTAVMQMLSAAVKDAGEQEVDFGERLEQARTAVQNFTDDLSKAVASSPAISEAMDTMAEAFEEVFGGTRQDALDAMMNLFDGFANAVSAAIPYIVDIAQAVGEFFVAGYKLLDSLGLIQGTIDVVKVSFVLLSTTLTITINAITELITWITNGINAFKTWISTSDSFVAKGLGGIISGMQTASNFIKGFVVDTGKAAIAQQEASIASNKQADALNGVIGPMEDQNAQLARSQKESAAAAEQTRLHNEKLINHAKVASDAAKANKEFNDAMAEISKVGVTVSSTLDGINGAVVEGAKYYLDHGVAVDKVATIYGLTKTQVDAVKTSMDTQKLVIEAVTDNAANLHKALGDIIDDQMKIAQANSAKYFKDWSDALDMTTKAQEEYSDTWKRLNLTDYEYAVDQINEWERKSYEALDANEAATSDMYGVIANTAAIKMEEVRRKHDEELAKMAESWPTWGNMAKKWIEDIPNIIQQAFTGGGGLSGALSAIATDIGSDVGTKLGTSLASSMSGFLSNTLGSTIGGAIGSIIPGLGGVIGSLAGPLIDGFIGLFHKPEFKKVMKDVGRDFGVDISEELGKAIAETEKVEGLERIQAVTLHLMDVINEAGGLTASNVEMFTGKLRDAFVYLTDGSMTVEQVTQTLDSTWAAFAQNAIEGDGLISASLLEIIDLNDQLGTKSQAIGDFLMQQAQSGVAGLDTMFKAFDSGITLTQDRATAFGDSVVGTFATLRENGMSFSDALKAIETPLNDLQAAMDKAGVSGSAAFSELSAMAAAAADPIKGPLIDALAGADQALKGLFNSNLLTQESFTAITGSAAEAAQKLMDMGMSGQQVGAIMQPTLQTIWELQQQFGYQVDETTQAMLDQAVAAGTVGEAHKSAEDRIADGVDRIAKATEGLARVFGVELPEAVDTGANAIAGSLDGVAQKSSDTATSVSDKWTETYGDIATQSTTTTTQIGNDFGLTAADITTAAQASQDAFTAAMNATATNTSTSLDAITADFNLLPGVTKGVSDQMQKSFFDMMANNDLTTDQKIGEISATIQTLTGVNKGVADDMAAKMADAFFNMKKSSDTNVADIEGFLGRMARTNTGVTGGMARDFYTMSGQVAGNFNALNQQSYGIFSAMAGYGAAAAGNIQGALNSVNVPHYYVPITYYPTNSPENMALGGVVGSVQYAAMGKVVDWMQPRGTDVVPAMLTPGEGVVNTTGMQKIGEGGLAAINAGEVSASDLFDSPVGRNTAASQERSITINFNGPVYGEEEYVAEMITPMVMKAISGGRSRHEFDSMAKNAARQT